MSHDDRCIECKAPLPNPLEPEFGCKRLLGYSEFLRRPLTLQTHLGDPFPATLSVSEIWCPLCGEGQAVFEDENRPHVREAWRLAEEVLREGYDYSLVGCRRGPVAGRPDQALWIAWAWLPVSDQTLSRRLFEALAADDDFHRRDVRSLLVLEEGRLPAWAADAVRRFDQVIVLRKHVLAGAFGPRPSLRAERSLVKSWQSSRLAGVKHYWPAGLLNDRDYVPLADKPELLRRFSDYVRAEISFGFTSKETA